MKKINKSDNCMTIEDKISSIAIKLIDDMCVTADEFGFDRDEFARIFSKFLTFSVNSMSLKDKEIKNTTHRIINRFGGETFTKDMISWQTTLVKFRNGLLGIAISDKVSDDDYDGNESFMVYDPDKKKFVGCEFLSCYDNNLKNTLSLKGIFNRIEGTAQGKSVTEIVSNKEELRDSEWDIVAVNPYPYAIDAFKELMNDDLKYMSYWYWRINE